MGGGIAEGNTCGWIEGKLTEEIMCDLIRAIIYDVVPIRLRAIRDRSTTKANAGER